MQEDVCAAVKESQPTNREDTRILNSGGYYYDHWTTNRKDTVGLHVAVNDVLCVQIAKIGKEKEKQMASGFLVIWFIVRDSLIQTYSMP